MLPKNGTVRRRKSDPIPWQLGTTAIAILRCSSGWGFQEKANHLLRLMKAEFSAIYFPRPAVALKTSMISMEHTSATSDDVFGDHGIV